MKLPGFKIIRETGFQLTFYNGVTVSVHFGPDYRCQHQDYERRDRIWKKYGILDNIDAEVVIVDKNNREITREYTGGGDDVIGWQSPEEVLKAMNWAAEK